MNVDALTEAPCRPRVPPAALDEQFPGIGAQHDAEQRVCRSLPPQDGVETPGRPSTCTSNVPFSSPERLSCVPARWVEMFLGAMEGGERRKSPFRAAGAPSARLAQVELAVASASADSRWVDGAGIGDSDARCRNRGTLFTRAEARQPADRLGARPLRLTPSLGG